MKNDIVKAFVFIDALGWQAARDHGVACGGAAEVALAVHGRFSS